MIIRLKHCRVHLVGDLTLTFFNDAPEDWMFSMTFPPETEYYPGIWADVGCPGDPVRYNFEHEFIHSWLAEKMWDDKSYVVWGNARGVKLSVVGAKYEERWVWHMHRYLNGKGPRLEAEWTDWAEEADRLLYPFREHFIQLNAKGDHHDDAEPEPEGPQPPQSREKSRSDGSGSE